MIEDELIKIWQSSPRVEQVKFEKSRLMLDLQYSLNRLERLANLGILIEQIGVIIIVPVFLFYIYFVPHLLSKIASLWIAIWAIWYMFRLRRIKRAKPKTISTNYLDYLSQWQAFLELNKSLGNTAVYWYILPPMFGYVLFVMGPYLEGKMDNELLAETMAFGLVVGVGTYFYLRWIVRKLYEPRLKKINELIKVMEE